MNIRLGDKVKDSVTGFTGIAIGRTEWLHGCARIIVQPTGVMKDGKLYDTQQFDEPQLVILKRGAVPQGEHEKGGPRPAVQQRQAPGRF
jgi:hypothetical protein